MCWDGMFNTNKTVSQNLQAPSNSDNDVPKPYLPETPTDTANQKKNTNLSYRFANFLSAESHKPDLQPPVRSGNSDNQL